MTSFQSELMNGIAKSRWLEHKSALILGAFQIYSRITSGVNVLVHCSDGWDRTSQLTALAQLMLDPYYRTLEGFAVLVNKEFVSFGHEFGERLGQIKYSKNFEEEQSPVFFLFLETVAHFVLCNPDKFEFDETFLLYLAFESFNNYYGNFLFTNEVEFIICNTPQFTGSVFNNL